MTLKALVSEIKPWSRNPFTQAEHQEWMRCGAFWRGHNGHKTWCDRDKGHPGGHQSWRWGKAITMTWWDEVVGEWAK